METRPIWGAGRRVTLAALAALGVGLLIFPEPSARLFWWGIVPLLPATFLIHPRLWRNVCPLATLGMGPAAPAEPGWSETRILSAGAAGVLPLLALVAARGAGLEDRAAATGLLVAGIVGVAVVAGRRGVRRAGFCNRLCPLLPVERLYGMQPLLRIADDRCPRCSGCTPRGCLDLSTRTVVPQLLGPHRDGSGWLATPFGGFAASFPGFVAAYFVGTGAAMGAGALFVTLAAGAALSWATTAAVVQATRISWNAALPTLAALAAGSYYGLSTPRAVAAWGGPPEWGRALGAALVLGVGAWWIRALRMSGGSRGSRRGLGQTTVPHARDRR